jgi:hypothetical protein
MPALLGIMALILNKKYKLVSTENFDQVMKALGKYAVMFIIITCRIFGCGADWILEKNSINISRHLYLCILPRTRILLAV